MRAHYWSTLAFGQLALAAALAACIAPAPATPVVVTRIVTVTPGLTAAANPRPTETAPATPTPLGALPANPTALPSLTPLPGQTALPGLTGAPAISITLFSAAPPLINPGDTITLAWEATGGELYLYRLNALGQLAEASQVPLTGTLSVTTTTSVRNQVSFALFAVDRATGAQAQAVAAVQVRCPDVWFFPGGPAACPQTAQFGRAVAEHFQRGLMVWLSWRGVYVLYSDGLNPRWDFRTDAYVEGQPESDPNIVPPEGLIQPVRGFGVIWRDERAVPGFRARDRLGWAIDREFEFDGAFQCDAAPKYATCYLRGPDGALYVLYPERSGWTTLATPAPTQPVLATATPSP